ADYGYAVTSPTHTQSVRNVDLQTVVVDREKSAPGGYDPEIAGATPWETGPLYPKARGYFREKMDDSERAAITKLGRVAHGVTDSAPSAGEFASGVKSYNTSINVAPDGRFVPTLFNQLQTEKGWKVGVVTSVGISDASPAAMYAHNVDRDDSQDLTRELLGEENIVQKMGKGPRLPGLDVLIGAGFGEEASAQNLSRSQGANAETGNPFLAPSTRKAVDIENGGKYVVAETTAGSLGVDVLNRAAEKAVERKARLFGFFGTRESHLPFRTTDGRYDPVTGRTSDGKSVPIHQYSPAHLSENPKLVDMTRAAIKVLSADPGKPFALFIEAGDVDWALHGNNLDNAIGCVYSGEDAVKAVIDWVEKNSNWDDSALIVTADHGHYLVIDDPNGLVSKK
ncbi:MAG: alkaline phosphatase, partial [Planctomycetes bacterium SCN 63-9]